MKASAFFALVLALVLCLSACTAPSTETPDASPAGPLEPHASQETVEVPSPTPGLTPTPSTLPNPEEATYTPSTDTPLSTEKPDPDDAVDSALPSGETPVSAAQDTSVPAPTESAPTPTPNTSVAQTGVYVGSIQSDKYHRPSCRYAKNILEENEIWFDTAEDAQAAGYNPCSVCKP